VIRENTQIECSAESNEASRAGDGWHIIRPQSTCTCALYNLAQSKHHKLDAY